MKSKPAGSKRNRIILIYFLGVVLPGLVLGFMAFRGIQSEGALREKQSRQELNMVSQDFFQLFLSELSNQNLINKAASLILEKEEEINLIEDKLLYVPKEFLNYSDEDFGPEPDKGWELEFIDKNLAEAEAYYFKLIENDPEKSGMLKALFALGRIQKKQEKYPEALETYQRIIDSFPQGKVGQLPAGLMAGIEKAQIYELMEDSQHQREEWEKISLNLLHPLANYNIGAFETTFQELVKNQNLLPEPDSIINKLEQKLHRTRHLNKFLKRAEDYLHAPNNQMIYLSNNGYSDLLIINAIDSTRTRASLLDLDLFVKERINNLLNQFDKNQYLWRIENEKGDLVFESVSGESPSFYSFPFPFPLSGWQLKLQVNPQTKALASISSGKGFYTLIFTLLAIWLLLGLIFTIYMLNQEIRLSKMKSRFISNVSHEFKSPVTSIRHMSELMKLGRVRTEQKKEDFYESMIDQCDHLGHLIENIMDFSKIEDEIKKYHFESIRVDELVDNLVSIHKNRLSESGMTLNFICEDDIPSIKADKDALQQVVYNLLDNAYKYASSGNKIDVILGSDENNVSIEVKDYGPGIPAEEHSRIFDRFYRIDDKNNEGIKGSGIGLTLVHKIVESHNGRVSLKSKTGNGSSFTVFLPIKKSEKDE